MDYEQTHLKRLFGQKDAIDFHEMCCESDLGLHFLRGAIKDGLPVGYEQRFRVCKARLYNRPDFTT
jgi:hypothetical protein